MKQSIPDICIIYVHTNHTLCAETGVGPDAITWEGGGVCFDPDAGLWPSGRLLSAPMCRQSFPYIL